jgi:hypothetical protein
MKPSRVVMFLIAGLLGSIALAEAGGPPVPEGCTFAAGRTVCTTVETSDEEVFVRTVCPDGSRFLRHLYDVTRTTTTTTVTYAGASSIVRSTEVGTATRTFSSLRSTGELC